MIDTDECLDTTISCNACPVVTKCSVCGLQYRLTMLGTSLDAIVEAQNEGVIGRFTTEATP